MILVEVFEDLVAEDLVRHVEVCVEELCELPPGHLVHGAALLLHRRLVHAHQLLYLSHGELCPFEAFLNNSPPNLLLGHNQRL